jgi:hypothetical protein
VGVDLVLALATDASALGGECHEDGGVGAELSSGFFPSGRSISPNGIHHDEGSRWRCINYNHTIRHNLQTMYVHTCLC